MTNKSLLLLLEEYNPYKAPTVPEFTRALAKFYDKICKATGYDYAKRAREIDQEENKVYMINKLKKMRMYGR